MPIMRLVRLPNLLVVALTQALVYYRIIQPALTTEGLTGVLSSWKFVELCVVTLLITASGYLIND
ncbi:MAG: prenyltransferase, partial [Bacteroidota bacterium]